MSSGKADAAKNLFLQGANCAQAVLGAFAPECGLSQEEAFRIASGFGAGFARLREVCGAVSGMVLVANFLKGNSDPSDKASKDAHYELVQRLTGEFRKETGSAFTDYVNALRIQEARRLLADPTLKVYEIAERVGFTDYHYFLKIFKKVTGKSPTDVRN